MSILKQTEDLRTAMVTKRYYNSSVGWTSAVINLGGKCIGSGRYDQFAKVSGPRQLPFSLNWVQHRRFKSSSGGVNVQICDQYGKPLHWFQGDLAACIGGVNPAYAPFAGDSSLRDRAVIDAAAKLLEPDVNYGMILAEASETIDLFTSPANFLAKQLRRLRRPRTYKRPAGQRLQSAFQYASDAWLQLRYAIMPTISDITDVVGKTTMILAPSFSKIHKKGGGCKGPESYNRTSGVVRYFTCYFQRIQTAGTEVNYISHIFYRIADYAAAERNRLGLGLSQVPSIAYEKIPFSFVLDWVVDVGSWIAAARPTPEYSRLGNTASVIRTNYGGTVVTHGSPYPGDIAWTPVSSSFVWSETYYDRGINVSLPVLPPVNADVMNFVRSLDASALAMKPTVNILKQLIK